MWGFDRLSNVRNRTVLQLLLTMLIPRMSLLHGAPVGPPVLGKPILLAGKVFFPLNGESNGLYGMETSGNLVEWAPLRGAFFWNSTRLSPDWVVPGWLLVVEPTNSAAYFRARVCQATFSTVLSSWTIFGTYLWTDSFDSTDPACSTEGRYDPVKAKGNGDIGVFSAFTNSLATIYGRILTAPDASVGVGPNSSVGSLAWHTAGTKGIEPGYLVNALSCGFPPVPPPESSNGSMLEPGTFNGTNYSYLLSTGNYEAASLSMSNQTMLVIGDAVLYLPSGFDIAGTASITIAPGGRLKMYVGGSGFIGGSGIVNHNDASAFIYYGLPTAWDLGIQSDSDTAPLIACIYAPNTYVSLIASGHHTINFVGAIVSGTTSLYGRVQLHFDENLRKMGPLF
jgi:hypothetical protein